MAYRVLVVTGESDTLRALETQLGDDIQVTLLESADEALWEVRENPPEAILAPVNLPGMSGLDLAEIMPNFEVPTRLVLWSIEDDQAARQQAEEHGVFRFLGGTVAPEALQAVIHEAVLAAPILPPPPPPVPEPAPAPAPAAKERPREEKPFTPARVVLPARDAEPEPEEAPVAKTRRPGGKEFTPARVVLPSPGSQPVQPPAPPTPPTPPPSSGRSSLAARTRASSERNAAAAPAPAPAPPPAPAPKPRRDGPMIVTAENLNPIRTIMSHLAQDLGAASIMLTNREGMVLVEIGNADGLPMMILLPLISTSFSTAGEVSRMLREDDATVLYIHEGVNYDLYSFDVAQRFLLVLVFNKKVANSKIGAVWVNTKRAIRELRDVLE